MLDYGFRSKCCKASIKIVHVKVKHTNIKKPIWVCLKCGSRDVNIISKEDSLMQD